MGHNTQKNKINVQKSLLKDIFVNMLDTNIAILKFQKTLTTSEKELKGINNWIKMTKTAKNIVVSIEHNEILASLYNAFVNGKESYFVAMSYTLTNKKKIRYWDRTKKGFKEFLEKESDAIEQDDKDKKEKKEMVETLKKAKEQGKRVEFMYVDKKLKPVIVNEKPN